MEMCSSLERVQPPVLVVLLRKDLVLHYIYVFVSTFPYLAPFPLVNSTIHSYYDVTNNTYNRVKS